MRRWGAPAGWRVDGLTAAGAAAASRGSCGGCRAGAAWCRPRASRWRGRARRAGSPRRSRPRRASRAGVRTRNTPNAVATPLPPRNRRNGEKQWPRMAAPPVASATRGSSAPRRARAVGSAPLAASSTSTIRPGATPSTRATLVAPMLPLPRDRMSTPRARATTTPNGIAPAAKPSSIQGQGRCQARCQSCQRTRSRWPSEVMACR